MSSLSASMLVVNVKILVASAMMMASSVSVAVSMVCAMIIAEMIVNLRHHTPIAMNISSKILAHSNRARKTVIRSMTDVVQGLQKELCSLAIINLASLLAVPCSLLVVIS
jgi:hypothetical protein